MNNKLLIVFASLCVLLLATQKASCEDNDVERPDEVYILNPESASPIIVTDPDSPLLAIDDRHRACYQQRCQQHCRHRGYRYGRCNNRNICVCYNR